ncbi:ParA family protein [Thermosulfurimonas sp. F29]|uniref:ParA family protein n=1 Tax=Thermosulfurimonas sp. F29 TaxID=2867247 RepID=UPI001C84000F|nr:ParA family protein [Thermosulfurimonas sp. F29]MBX6424270.1 ParA family protein [Thermosulfurimonas sp. F29]
MKVIVVANQKGGVGKTSLVFHLAHAISEEGGRVMVIDLDPQGNLSWCLRRRTEEACPAAEIFEREVLEAEPCTERILLVASNIKLARYEAAPGGMRIYFKLRRALERHRENPEADYVLIDCPPSLGLFSLAALVAGHRVVIPMRTEIFSVSGLGDLLNVVEEVRESVNPGLEVAGIVMNAVSSRTRVAQSTLEELAELSEELSLPVLAVLPATVRLEEALREGIPVWRLKEAGPMGTRIRKEIGKILNSL